MVIDLAHAARIAYRLARHRRRSGDEFIGRIEQRLWALLDTRPEAREAYGRPHDRTLVEHSQDLTLAELEDAAERLATRSVAEGGGTHGPPA